MQFRRGKPATGAFFDSDFSTIDSVLAVALLHGQQAKNEGRLIVITMSRPNLAVTGYMDAVERFYRGPAGNFSQVPPIGMRTSGAPGETAPAFTAPLERKKPDGSPLYVNQVKSVIETADPNTLLRNYLLAEYDQNATFVLGGPATNLASALDFPGIKPLLAAKIKYLVMAAGAFPDGPAEPHVKADIPAARKVLAEWPTSIIASGHEVGEALQFPGSSIDKEFAAAVPDNPVADAYRACQAIPYDSPSWALAAALYAARPQAGYFKLSDPGSITIAGDGRTSFSPSAKGRHRYLIVDPEQADNVRQAYVELASAKPVPRRRFRLMDDDQQQDLAADAAEKPAPGR